MDEPLFICLAAEFLRFWVYESLSPVTYFDSLEVRVKFGTCGGLLDPFRLLALPPDRSTLRLDDVKGEENRRGLLLDMEPDLIVEDEVRLLSSPTWSCLSSVGTRVTSSTSPFGFLLRASAEALAASVVSAAGEKSDSARGFSLQWGYGLSRCSLLTPGLSGRCRSR